MSARLIIVGGGVAGLAVAHNVRRRIDAGELPGWSPRDVLVLEASERPGGFCVTDLRDGYLLDWGPNGFLDNEPATLRLVDRLGLRPRLRPAADAAAHRFLFLDGRLRPVPTSPAGFLRSGVLSWRGKLRLLGEPLVPPRRDDGDEPVAAFARRRVGAEFVERLLDPMISGVYAGDVERLSLHGALPRMAALEREHGGLIRGMIALARARRRARRRGETPAGGGPAGPGGTLHTFAQGAGELTAALAGACGAEIRCGCRAVSVRRAGAGYAVAVAEGEHGPPGGRDTAPGRAARPAPAFTVSAPRVVLACPAREAAAMLADLDPELAAPLWPIAPAPIAVAALGYAAGSLAHPADGFGFLIPRREGVRTLGVLWTSSFFPHQAPAGKVLLRAMVGGACDPEAAALSDDQLLAVVQADLRRTMDLRAAPEMVRIYRFREGIPQYAVGHRARLTSLADRLRAWPGLQVTGNSLHGISINHCVREAEAVAAAVEG